MSPMGQASRVHEKRACACKAACFSTTHRALTDELMVAAQTTLLVGRGVYALALARLLRQHQPDMRLLLATTDPDDWAGASRHISQVHVLPRPDRPSEHDTSTWQTQLLELLHAYRPSLVLPVGEEGLYAAEAHATGAWPAGCVLALPPLPTLRALHDKLAFYEVLRRAGVKTPHTRAYAPGMSPPGHAVVLKPVFSRGGMCAVLWRPGEAWPPTALRSVVAGEDCEGRHWLVQTFVEGTPLSTFAVLRAGANGGGGGGGGWCVAALVSYACELCVGQLAPPSETGGSSAALQGFASLRCSVRSGPAEAATSAVAALLRNDAADAAAPAWLPPVLLGLDFVVEEGSGAVYCLECNPRATNGVGLLGAHAPAAMAAAAALIGPAEPPAPRAPPEAVVAPAGLVVRTSLAALSAVAGVGWRGLLAAPRLAAAHDDMVLASDPRPAAALLLAVLRAALAHCAARLAARGKALLSRLCAAASGRSSHHAGLKLPPPPPRLGEQLKARLAAAVVTWPPEQIVKT